MKTATTTCLTLSSRASARFCLFAAVLVALSQARRHPLHYHRHWGYATVPSSPLSSSSFPLIHARDGLSSISTTRAASSMGSLGMPQVQCSGGACSYTSTTTTSPTSTATTGSNNNASDSATSQSRMRGGSTCTAAPLSPPQQPNEEASSLQEQPATELASSPLSSSSTSSSSMTSSVTVKESQQQPASAHASTSAHDSDATTATLATASTVCSESASNNSTSPSTSMSLLDEQQRATPTSEAAVSTTTTAVVASSPKEATTRLPHPHQGPYFETRKEKRERIKRHKQIAKQLKNRNARNMRRKVLHACFGLTFATLNHILPKTTFVPCMAFLSSATLVMELLRYRKGFGWMNAALHGVLGQSLRKHEMEGKFTGSFYFFTGVTITSWCFDTTSATLGICQLALADPSASYFGRKTRHIYWSRIENGLGGFGRNKGVLGFLGGALFCFPFNYRVLRVAAKRATIATGAAAASPTTAVIVAASLLLGVAGAFADLAVPTPALVLPKKILGVRVPPFHVDDNMVVPIFSAYACQEIFRFLHLNHLPLTKWLLF